MSASTPGNGAPISSAVPHRPRGSTLGNSSKLQAENKGLSSTASPKPDDDSDDAANPRHALEHAASREQVEAALAALHAREAALTARLDAAKSPQAAGDLHRALGRLDGLRAGLGAQAVAARAVASAMLAAAADTAARLSGRVRALDLEKARVGATLAAVDQVAELKACVAGVVGSMGAPQDWEAAAGYVARADRVPEAVMRSGFAAAVVPTVEVPDPPWVTLESAKESLCGLFVREFERAAKEADGARVTRFFKLFPLIGRGGVGLDIYGRYVCQGVAGGARAVLREDPNAAAAVGTQARRDGYFYANALTRLFEHIAQIVESHGGLVERHYGAGKMVRVIERLQMEADVQGGIILDSWSDERIVDRKLTDVKSYPFSFLVQSFLPPQRALTGTPRMNSPALGAGQNSSRDSEDEGVNMKEVDGLLSEISLMLGRWALYSRFLAGKCMDPGASDGAPLVMPTVLLNSNLRKKVSAKLTTPYNVMTTFFFRRSVEKAFQLDESPAGLSLSMSKPVESSPPFVSSAVDDVMYIVNNVFQKSLSTCHRDVIASAVPSVSRVLTGDFVGMIQRKMRDETYPKAAVAGGFPPEDKIIAFVVQINSLDMANEYLDRIIAKVLGIDKDQSNGTASHLNLKDSFPFEHDVAFVTHTIQGVSTSFAAKTADLLNDGLQVLFNNVVKPRLRPVLADTFRDADYALDEDELAELAAQRAQDGDDDGGPEALLEQVPRRFTHGWDALMRPIGRLMTRRTFASLLGLTATYLARVLEKRVWTYAGGGGGGGGGNRKPSAHGALRMERDFSAIASAVARGNYAVREPFVRVAQILMVANMEEEEWDEINGSSSAAGAEDGDDGIHWILTESEKTKARSLVRGSSAF